MPLFTSADLLATGVTHAGLRLRISAAKGAQVLKQNLVWFDAVGMNDVDKVGGKNASLGEMISQLTA
jgi:hypothetical protein